MKKRLLTEAELAWSSVVANNSMNRERVAYGVNSYHEEINLNPVDFIAHRKNQISIQWTDLCCGSGNALIQAANYFKGNSSIKLIGIDLVKYFSWYEKNTLLELKQLDLSNWKSNEKNDLITIVHGLHYIGNKIELIQKAATALKQDGVFIANLDIENIQIDGAKNSKQLVLSFFEQNNVKYNKIKKIITIQGYQEIQSKFIYLGADDKAGANYTGQKVVDSFYTMRKPS